ncbi:hypothetical protein HDU81_000949 [Chytriomyces hyalinus]|nr:hypothetical protein HDU81_000949 [Chytriomyces hyalinus]
MPLLSKGESEASGGTIHAAYQKGLDHAPQLSGALPLRVEAVFRFWKMSQPLPPGWIMQTDPNTRAAFYVNTATGQSQWTAPPMQYAPPPGNPPGQYAPPPHQPPPPQQYQQPPQQYQQPPQQYQQPPQQYQQQYQQPPQQYGNPQVPAYLAQNQPQQPMQQYQQPPQQQQPQKQGVNPLLLAGGAAAAAAVVGGILYEKNNEHFDGGVLDFLDHGPAALMRKKDC